MNLILLNPRKALNKAYLKTKPGRTDYERFKSNLIILLKQTNELESEEFHKLLIASFLKNTYYEPEHFVNTKGRNDLVIHNGKESKNTVGVIVETKRPNSKTEMLQVGNLNKKAFQELVLYYLRERIIHKNIELKHLVVCNVYEWFIFDAQLFDRAFAQNKKIVEQFMAFEEKRLADTTTDFFYKEIAEPAIRNLDEIQFTYFDIREYKSLLQNNELQDNKDLIALYKIFSPEHLLNLPFSNDSNSLNKTFYDELLHIIGLEEINVGKRKYIKRKDDDIREEGSLIENTITQLESSDKLARLEKPYQYGKTNDERLFNIALELVITWINRILFIKLLEAQIGRYQNGNRLFTFLNLTKITDYDDLNKLFFQVLARKNSDRSASIQTVFGNVPYLNSTLFEPSEMEHRCIFINHLSNGLKLGITNSTVLKDNNGKKKIGSIQTLEYLFDFLDAYDFSSEGAEDIQDENKTLINASVLGLLFEKLNGYKEGSFFTPGFVTMYMCRESIRRAIVQKFNSVKNWQCQNIDQLYDKIDDKQEANQIINSLKICDPAVGSGHFLVSALNEIITVKSDLKILRDRTGKTLRDYHIEVENDELVITDDDGGIFEYHPHNIESQRIQETLFHEKQAIIENCLFGVDINPNSVNICRLRLWIELLKNAYYTSESNFFELETLPNIDINIKCGNSLINRYLLDTDIKEVLKKNKRSVHDYVEAVVSYRHAKDKADRRAMENLVAEIKTEFRNDVLSNDTRQKTLIKKKSELEKITSQLVLFERTKTEIEEREKVIKELTKDVFDIELKLEQIKSGKIYENSFEWRFEFPEVLNDNGDFCGFDVVIGNPPYGVELEDQEKELYKETYKDFHTRWPDTFNYFIPLSLGINNSGGVVNLITPNNLLFQNEYEKARKQLLNHYQLTKAINLGDDVFADAQVPTCIVFMEKTNTENYDFLYTDLRDIKKDSLLFDTANFIQIDKQITLNIPGTIIGVDSRFVKIFAKVKDQSETIDKVALEVANGIQPSGDKIFRIDEENISNYAIERSILKKVLVGSDFNKYSDPMSEYWVIYTTKSTDITKIPNTMRYLENYKQQLSTKRETKKGTIPWYCLHWPRYSGLFEDPKIILRQTADNLIATYDENSFYAMNNTIILQLNPKYDLDYKFVLGLLNSNLYSYIYENLVQETGRTFAEVKPKNIRKLPVKVISKSAQKPLIEVVTEILSLKKKTPDADVSDLEKMLNEIVYSLYELTDVDISIVDERKNYLLNMS